MHDWRDIVDSHAELVWRIAYRVLRDENDAADCHQDVFMDALSRAQEKPVANWPAFLRWLTVRRAIDLLRRRRRRSATRIAAHPSPESGGDRPDERCSWSELMEIVRTELTALPSNQAEVFWLHCVEETPLVEIAAKLRVSANHARVLLYRARSKLKTQLAHKHPSLAEDLA